MAVTEVKMRYWRECFTGILSSFLALALVSCAGGTKPTTSQEAPSSEQNESAGPAESDDSLSKTEAATKTAKGKADWTGDICDRNEWYGDYTCDWFCPKDDPDCNVEVLGEKPQGKSTTYPIVLAHGFDGSTTNRWSFNGVAQALRRDGHKVVEAEVPPYQSPEVRSEYLAEDIRMTLQQFGVDKVNIIAHSMGGLDARHLVEDPEFGEQIASLSTVGTPHKGAPIADTYLEYIGESRFDAVIDALAKAWGLTYNELADDTDVRAAMRGLSTARRKEFNQSATNPSGVDIQSWAGVSRVSGTRPPEQKLRSLCDDKLMIHDGTMDKMSGLLWPMAPFSGDIHDGMVPVENARWGDFRGCIPADHYDQVGQVGDDGMVKHTGFDHIRFYRNIAFGLAEEGY